MPFVDPELRRAKDAEYKRRRRQRDACRVLAAEAKYRATHREERRAAERARDAAQPERVCEEQQRRRARLAGNRCERYSRAEIFARYDGLCGYCAAPATVLDHIEPVAKGGADAEDNLIPACTGCNGSKGAKPLLLWLARRAA